MTQQTNKDPREVQKKEPKTEDLLLLIQQLNDRIQVLENVPPPDPYPVSKQELAEEFESYLNSPPKVIKVHSGNKYVPIETIEKTLDDFFGLRWQTRNVQVQLMVNTITVTLELGIFHPIWEEWIWRPGFGAVQIQWTSREKLKDAGIKYDITDFNQMVPTAIEKNFPSAKSRAIKNAAGFGRVFGRDIENKDTNSPEPISVILRNLREIETERRDEAKQLIRETGDRTSLDSLWKENVKTWNNDPFILQMFKDRVEEGFPQVPK